MNDFRAAWPSLPLAAWQDTYDTLRLWMQIVGKFPLRLKPFVNHWWEASLFVTTRGLRTQTIPYGQLTFEMEFDFNEHLLTIRTSDGRLRAMSLAPKSVADFYLELMEVMDSLGIDVPIDTLPREIPNPIPFPTDQIHRSYDSKYAHRYFRALVQADRVLNQFRSGFWGKASPVHFFWGSFDLAYSRFSGRRAPLRPEADHITQVGYSHELWSVGFWPGSGNIQEPAFYAYAAPEPSGFAEASVTPRESFYNPPTRGFILRYEDVIRSADPDKTILEFCESTYEAAATLGRWDRENLERPHFELFSRAV